MRNVSTFHAAPRVPQAAGPTQVGAHTPVSVARNVYEGIRDEALWRTGTSRRNDLDYALKRLTEAGTGSFSQVRRIIWRR